MKCVIVESPSKAKTIGKYLGADYKVVASFGHVRDLPSKNGSVNPDDKFSMTWEISPESKKHIDQIYRIAKDADTIYLAPDPDREGEAIAWHIYDILSQKRGFKSKTFHRVAFNEITQKAVKHAIDHPRGLDQQLIDAYLTRRALDYLVGFNVSPLLWRRLPGSRSAGRVQSVALRLIADRELEIEAFKTQEYWSVQGKFDVDSKDAAHDKNVIDARLIQFENQKWNRDLLGNEDAAKAAVEVLKSCQYKIHDIQSKKQNKRPPAPFITSTLQQEAAKKLYFSTQKTMQLAQRLYEGVDIGGQTVGLITYMRTDSVYVNNDAIKAARGFIEQRYGKDHVSPSPRMFKTKSKNAQEAHEAIRPSNFSLPPEQIQNYLDQDLLKLYRLIWNRMVASQMSDAIFNMMRVDIADLAVQHIFRVTGSHCVFKGYLSVFDDHTVQKDTLNKKKTNDDDGFADESMTALPAVEKNASAVLLDALSKQHFTQPPPRYNEASLVKHLEELGIGRPSTYASIIRTLLSRDYVRLEKRQFIPEQRGIVVSAYLQEYFKRYVEYDFTAKLEAELDHIAHGDHHWQNTLEQFWQNFESTVKDAEKVSITDVLDSLNETLKDHLFGRPNGEKYADGSDVKTVQRDCPKCKEGDLSLKVSRFGMFLGCSRYPDCNYTENFGQDGQAEGNGASGVGDAVASEFPRVLSKKEDETQEEISVCKGPYGFYVQKSNTELKKPKRVALPKSEDPMSVDLERALFFLQLPIIFKTSDGEELKMNIGRFGPYLYDGHQYVSLPSGVTMSDMNAEKAEDIVKTKRAEENVGMHPEMNEIILRKKGRFGHYLKCGDIMAPIPKTVDPMDVDVPMAVELIAKKVAKGGAKKPAAKKTTVKKTTAKKKAVSKKK